MLNVRPPPKCDIHLSRFPDTRSVARRFADRLEYWLDAAELTNDVSLGCARIVCSRARVRRGGSSDRNHQGDLRAESDQRRGFLDLGHGDLRQANLPLLARV